MVSKRIAAVMIDLSGTVHVGQNLLPGAKEAIDLLRENQVILKSGRLMFTAFLLRCPSFLSQTTPRSRCQRLLRDLKEQGWW